MSVHNHEDVDHYGQYSDSNELVHQNNICLEFHGMVDMMKSELLSEPRAAHCKGQVYHEVSAEEVDRPRFRWYSG